MCFLGKKSIFEYRTNFRRLLNEVSKFKEVLSANKESYLYIESLLEDIDFKVLVERAVFEDKSRELTDRIHLPIEKILSKAQKTVNDIDVIEIIGGGVRIPIVQSKLSDFFKGKEIGAHLNGDEAMSLGAVFQAANYSSIYRVRPIWLSDGYGYAIKLTVKGLDNGEVLQEVDLFDGGDYFGKKRQIRVNEVKDLQFVFERIMENEKVEVFKVYNFTNIDFIQQVFILSLYRSNFSYYRVLKI